MKTTRKEPPIAVLLGLPFHDLTLEETLEYCREAMKGDAGGYLVTANVDFTAQAYEDPDLKKIVFFADRVVCDGMPLVWLSKIFGYPLRERVAGSDMVPRLLEICGKEGFPVFFFGSDIKTLEEAKIIVEERYPGLRVVGLDSPPMGAVVEWDNEALCGKIKASGARLLLVCLGCPKQERWIFAHHREAGVPLSIGVGASLDFITGKQKRAPLWMQKTGLEWFWRMSSSPSRLVSRYAKDLVFLTTASLRQAGAQRRREDIALAARSEPAAAPEYDSRVTRIEWSGELQHDGAIRAEVPQKVDSPVFLDASRVTFADSAGLGRLASLVRVCRAAGQFLILVNPSGAFETAIRAAQMDSLFPVVDSEKSAMALVSSHRTHDVVNKENADGVIRVSFHRSLDALYHDEMVSILESAIADAPHSSTLVVDLTHVTFIDSRAVGGLIRAWKSISAKNGAMFLAGANPSVKEIISLLRLDKVLAEWKEEVAG